MPSVTIRPILTAALDEAVPSSADTSTETERFSPIIESANVAHNLDRYGPTSIGSPRPDALKCCCTAAIVCILQVQSRFLRLHGAGLQQEDAGDDLQAVGNAVLHLFQ